MREEPTAIAEPAPSAARGGRCRDRVALACATAFVRATLLVSPRPAALLLRRVFAAGGAEVARKLVPHTPADVGAVVDERYGDGPDELLDVYRPAAATAPLPVVVWVHGGGWIGGTKEELSGYLKLLASEGHAVAALRYSLAPEARYPTPLRQIMAALGHLQANAARLGVDPARIVLCGDSAGAQLAAQVAALATTPGYADAVGVAPTVAPGQLRGVVLACGPYDLGLLGDGGGSAAGRLVATALLRAYLGGRTVGRDPRTAELSVTDHLTPAFPPALVTVGNADPLRAHSELLVARLRAHGVATEELFFAPDRRPPLGHEYQFDLDTDAGRRFLQQVVAFLRERLG